MATDANLFASPASVGRTVHHWLCFRDTLTEKVIPAQFSWYDAKMHVWWDCVK